MSKNKIIVCNTQGKKEISNILDDFEKDKTRNFKEMKYKYANQLINFKKSDLETAKSDIEFSIDNQRTLNSVFAIIGTIITAYVLLEELKPIISGISTFFFAGLGYFIFNDVAGKIASLHVLKIAIAQKSEIESTNNQKNIDLS